MRRLVSGECELMVTAPQADAFMKTLKSAG